jgi:hypothetical protein
MLSIGSHAHAEAVFERGEILIELSEQADGVREVA